MTLEKPTDELLERICDAHWNGSGEGVKFLDIHQHNACNHTLSGTVEEGGETYGFIVQNGDWNGMEVKAWGDPEDVGTYDPGPPPEPLTFVPDNPLLFKLRPEMWRVYAAWRKEPWFKEKEGAYNYDRHFQPGGYVENYYRKWAAKKGMRPGLFSNLSAEERASL